MSVSSLKQKKGWRKVLPHVVTVASTAKAWHYSYGATALSSPPYYQAIPINIDMAQKMAAK